MLLRDWKEYRLSKGEKGMKNRREEMISNANNYFDTSLMTVILVAAGISKRFALGNKMFYPIDGKSVFEKSLRFFLERGFNVVVAASKDVRRCFEGVFKAHFVDGGRERKDSVYNALKEVETEYVLIHDAARCFVNDRVLNGIIESLNFINDEVCAVPAVGVADTVRVTEDNLEGPEERMTGKWFDRRKVWLVQTPQAFKTRRLKELIKAEKLSTGLITDEAFLFEKAGFKVILTQGDSKNVKITHVQDIYGKWKVVEERMLFAEDVHRVREGGSGLKLAGIDVAKDLEFIAHSDGDVVLHAVTEALLSMWGLDLGEVYPASRVEKGIDSSKLLEPVINELWLAGWVVLDVRVQVETNAMKLARFREKMRANLAYMLGVLEENVSVTFLSGNGVGEEGRGEAVRAKVFLRVGRVV